MCVVEAAVGERQQWGVEGALRVPQDGIMLIDVLHNLWIEFILLYKNSAHKHTEKCKANETPLIK